MIITPHNKKSTAVEEKDWEKVEDESLEMIALCKKRNGKYPSAFAIAHSQVSNEPLRFFALADGRVIVNPEIINHTKVPVDHLEGCMSYPERRMVVVKRWNKCTVKYTELSKNWKRGEKEENLSGMQAFIFQHEINHLDGIDIYSKEGSKELVDSAIGPLSEELYKKLERTHAL